MAWTIDSIASQTGDLYILSWTGLADASDLTDTVLVDVDALSMASGATPTKTQVTYFYGAAGGVAAKLEWDHTTDDPIILVPPGCVVTLPAPHPEQAADVFTDPSSSGQNGDIVVTTLGGAVGDGLYIYMEVLLIA